MAWVHYTNWLADGEQITAEQLGELVAAVGERMSAAYAMPDGVGGTYDPLSAVRLRGAWVRWWHNAVLETPSGLDPAGEGPIAVSPSNGYPLNQQPSNRAQPITTALSLLHRYYTGAPSLNYPATSFADMVDLAAARLTADGYPTTRAEFFALENARLDSPRRWNMLRALVIVCYQWLFLAPATGRRFTKVAALADYPGPEPWWSAEAWAWAVAQLNGVGSTETAGTPTAFLDTTTGVSTAVGARASHFPLRLSAWAGWSGATVRTWLERTTTAPWRVGFSVQARFLPGGSWAPAVELVGLDTDPKPFDWVLPAYTPAGADQVAQVELRIAPRGWPDAMTDFGTYADPVNEEVTGVAPSGVVVAVRPVWVRG